MFKFLSKHLHKSNKGFTLIELIVTLFLLAIVTGMIAQITFHIYRDYKMVEDRWKMQNEVNYVMKLFEGNKEALTTSHQADIFYDLNCSSVPATGDTAYSYIYAKPRDTSNLKLGYDLWYLERDLDPYDGVATKPVQLNSETIPINIEFSIPVAPNPLVMADGTVAVDPDQSNEQGYVTEVSPPEDKLYQTSTVKITVSGSGTYSGKYVISTSFTLNNMLGNQRINYTYGEPTDTTKRADGTAISDVYLAGWTDENINNKAENKNLHYPIAFTESADGVYYETLPGNVIRYISIESFLNSTNPTGNAFDMLNKCGLSGAIDGTAIEVPVKGALRDFRDNVLAGTKWGDAIINRYYTEWSPAIWDALRANPKLTKAVCCVVSVPAAIVAYFISD